MDSAVKQCGWFADSHESRFKAANRSYMGKGSPVRWLISYFSGIAFSGFGTSRYVQWHPAWWSICWCSEITFQCAKNLNMGLLSSYEVDLLKLRNRVLRLRNVQKRAVPSRKVVELLILRNRVLLLRIVHIWVMPSCKGVDYLLNRNLVFRLRMVQIWAVPSCKRVQLLMLRNCVFSLRIVQICVMQSCKREMSSFFGISFSGCKKFSYEECHIRRRQICWCTVITYSGCETLVMCSAEPLECWSAGAQESRFHSANLSNMGNHEM